VSRQIVLINPNSDEEMTNAINLSIAPLRFKDGPKIKCITLAEGPPGIETDAEVQSVIAPLCKLACSLEARTAAFINACFSDPGLAQLRAVVQRPVFGIAESALLTAMALGRRVGILSILNVSVKRHAHYIESLGITNRIVGDYSIDLGIQELKDTDHTRNRLCEVGHRLQKECSTDVIVLGCAGLSIHRIPLELEIGCPIVDPCQAALAMAITAVRLH
jgi:Asp/Glu/hydantoin racemase